ncbi:putative uncharacterized protein [Ruminococcus sp. CAG:353]|nr:putative uncharacterized protein [Ruminococcus sp. CAG:353]
MNIFSIINGDTFELTRDNYMEATKKQYPYYQKIKGKKSTSYFAICPACKNPINIVNLIEKQYEEKKTHKIRTHGRHHKNNVKGLAIYNQQNYDNCPLHNPIAFRLNEIRNDDAFNNVLLKIIQDNNNKIIRDIREITGIYFKNTYLNQIIKEYISARNYRYTHTNKFNIPYCILYAQQALDLFGQKINTDTSNIGALICEAISQNSNFFTVTDNQIMKKPDISSYVNISLMVSHHVIRGEQQFIRIRVNESCDNIVDTIFKRQIEMRQYIYD